MTLSMDDATEDAIDAAKHKLRAAGNPDPSDLQAAVLFVVHLSTRFGRDVLRRAYFAKKESA